MALAEVVNRVKFLRQVEKFIITNKRICAIPTMKDNQEDIEMVNSKHSNSRAQHIDVKHHVIRDDVEEGIIRISSMSDWETNTADILTKSLATKVDFHAKALSVDISQGSS